MAREMLSTLHDTIHNSHNSWWNIVPHGRPQFRFFVLHHLGRIRFFLETPEEHRQFLESQLYAHYSDIEITAQTTAAEAPESTSEQGYVLLPSYRFAHQRGYVQTLVSGAGFQNVLIEDVVLRQEAAGPVHGFLVIAQKPEKSVRRSPKSAKPARRTG